MACDNINDHMARLGALRGGSRSNLFSVECNQKWQMGFAGSADPTCRRETPFVKSGAARNGKRSIDHDIQQKHRLNEIRIRNNNRMQRSRRSGRTSSQRILRRPADAKRSSIERIRDAVSALVFIVNYDCCRYGICRLQQTKGRTTFRTGTG